MNWKFAFILMLLILLTVFSAQNYEVVEIRFLFWSFQASRVIVIFLAFVSGIIAGWLAAPYLKKE